MPRSVRVLFAALAIALVVAWSSTAFADTTSGYTDWTSGPPNDTSLPLPHKDFQLTTQKCAVCHAVHKADAGGQLLLRSSVQDACVYCHIETDIGVDRVYNGVTANYTTEDNRGHQSPAVKCVDCHAVHGANTFNGNKTAFILKVFDIQQTVIDELAAGDTSLVINATGDYTTVPEYPPNWEAPQIQDTAFCSQCHPYYTAASETTITDDVRASDGSTYSLSFKAHPIKMPGGEGGSLLYEGFVAEGSTIPTSTAVAVYSTRGCRWNCHQYGWGETGPGVIRNSYPHYMVDTVRFLAAAPDADAALEPVQDSKDDGVCLHCHVWTTEADRNGIFVPPGGVGVTY